MNYIALARKWRPRTFSQLIGQEPINKALSNSLNQNRLHHAYLFTGTRGVGKTSVARLLAKALNCEKGITSEPCLECDACLAIEQGRFIDLIEIDGASRTRVEDTREVLENVQYLPTSGRFKIYLIDEVHMLSQHSFNALLKTLEEPPSHVKFLLATTDPQKLPITVLSRCLHFNLQHLQVDAIYQHLEHIMQQEQLSYDKEALMILAKAARGSMRDALSLLDQAIASSNGHLETETVKQNLGYTKLDYALQLLDALAQSKPEKLITISKQIALESGHFHYVIEEMLSYLHQMSIHQAITENLPFFETKPELLALANQFTPEDTQLLYQIGIKGLGDLHLAPTLSIGFEMMLLRMHTFRPAPKEPLPPLSVASTIEVSEESVREKELSREDASTPSCQFTGDIDTSVHEDSSSLLSKQLADEVNQPKSFIETESAAQDAAPTDWNTILPKLKLSGLALSAAEQAELVSISERDITLRVAKGHQSVFTKTVIQRIEQGLTSYYKKVLKLNLINEDVITSSPAQQRAKVEKKLHENAEAALKTDPFFQKLQEEFSAELVKGSVTALEE
jgi:DNA polymerase-3 subunit gamma/tau